MTGQLFEEERDFLARIIRANKPACVVECGTCAGGGSTLAIAKAIDALGSGTLFTWESDHNRYVEATEGFEVEYPHLIARQRVVLRHGDFLSGMLDFEHKPDMAFLDGPENAAFTVAAFTAISCWCSDDCTVVFHDWCTEKCRMVREIVDASSEWQVEAELKTQTGIASVVKCS